MYQVIKNWENQVEDFSFERPVEENLISSSSSMNKVYIS